MTFKENPKGIRKSMGMYDSDTGKTVFADKIIDITSQCKDEVQVVLKYANITKGRIVQICSMYEKGKDLGTCIHFLLDNINDHESFTLRAKTLGITRELLYGIILSNSN